MARDRSEKAQSTTQGQKVQADAGTAVTRRDAAETIRIGIQMSQDFHAACRMDAKDLREPFTV